MKIKTYNEFITEDEGGAFASLDSTPEYLGASTLASRGVAGSGDICFTFII